MTNENKLSKGITPEQVAELDKNRTQGDWISDVCLYFDHSEDKTKIYATFDGVKEPWKLPHEELIAHFQQRKLVLSLGGDSSTMRSPAPYSGQANYADVDFMRAAPDMAQLIRDQQERIRELTANQWKLIEECPANGFFLVYQNGAVRTMHRTDGKWEYTGVPVRVDEWGDMHVEKNLKITDCLNEPTHWQNLPYWPPIINKGTN